MEMLNGPKIQEFTTIGTSAVLFVAIQHADNVNIIQTIPSGGLAVEASVASDGRELSIYLSLRGDVMYHIESNFHIINGDGLNSILSPVIRRVPESETCIINDIQTENNPHDGWYAREKEFYTPTISINEAMINYRIKQ